MSAMAASPVSILVWLHFSLIWGYKEVSLPTDKTAHVANAKWKFWAQSLFPFCPSATFHAPDPPGWER